MNQWGDYQEVVRQTRDLLDRQQKTSAETRKIAQETMGKKADELSADEAARSRATTRDQERLAEETDRLMQQMYKVAHASRARDPTGSELMQQAGRTGRAVGVTRRMKQAAEAMRRNQGGQAGREQQAAEAALQEMLDQLEQRRERELAELAKRLEQVEEIIRLLVQQQVQLRDENLAARGQPDVDAQLRGQADRQTVLKRNTQQLAEEIGQNGSNAGTTQISRAVATGATKMGRAATKLAGGLSEPAEADQTAAIEALEAALQQLAALKQKTEQQIARRALADIRKTLQSVRDKQAALRTDTAALAEKLAADQRITRSDTRRIRRLSTEQTELQATSQALREEISKAVVYDWMMGRVIELMVDVRDRLDERKLDAETVAIEDKVLARLDQLLEASVEEPPSDEQQNEFASGGGQGGQGGQQGQSGIIPATAEIKVLKMMQGDIYSRTTKLHKTLDLEQASEKSLQELKDLGLEQKQLRELLEQAVSGAGGGR
jgi:DNA repair exonuclease SbcCD ATPase subunit